VIAAVLDEKLAWYISRASGLLAWTLCGLSIVWGLALSTKLIRRRGLPAWLMDLHSFLGGLAVVFTGVHLAALVADNYTVFGWRELFVPMASEFRPGAVAWGIVAFYLLIAIQLTSLIRKRLSRRLWHTVHLTSFGVFGAGTLHGIQAGSDWSNLMVKIGSLVVGALVVWWTVLRILRRADLIRPIVVGASSSADLIEVRGAPALEEYVPVPIPVAVPIPVPVAVPVPIPVAVPLPVPVAVPVPIPVPVAVPARPGMLPPEVAMSLAAALLASPPKPARQAVPATGQAVPATGQAVPATGQAVPVARNTVPPVALNVVFPPMSASGSSDQNRHARVGASSDDVRQADPGAVELTVGGVTPQLADQLDDLSEGAGPERLALAEQSAGRVDPTT